MRRISWSFVGVVMVVSMSFGWAIAASPSRAPEQAFTPRYGDLVFTKKALAHARPNLRRSTPAPVAALVGHHLLAAEQIANTIRRLPSQKIRHVILIAPNHFSEGWGRIQTIDQPLATPYGPIAINHDVVRGIVAEGGATVEPATFLGEHGVANILPYIKVLLPDADVVPIVVWEGLQTSRLDHIRAALANFIQPNTLILGSFDFSHYVPSATALQQDRISQDVLNDLDLSRIRSAKVDSPDGLWLWLAVTRDAGATTFRVDTATNSGILAGAPASTEVTSYIMGRVFR